MSIILTDRKQAGRALARKLDKYAGRPDCVVVGLPRGGVVVAAEIAAALHLPLDVCLVRKLGVPFQPELAMGAVASGGVRVLNEELIQRLKIKKWELDLESSAETAELNRREETYRHGRPMLPVRDKTVILADDGVATGATLEAAIDALKIQGAEAIIVAVGVAAPGAVYRLSPRVKDFLCVRNPDMLMAVADWYADFHEVTDTEVCDLLAKVDDTAPIVPSTP